jgi:hypothetical protein
MMSVKLICLLIQNTTTAVTTLIILLLLVLSRVRVYVKFAIDSVHGDEESLVL